MRLQCVAYLDNGEPCCTLRIMLFKEVPYARQEHVRFGERFWISHHSKGAFKQSMIRDLKTACNAVFGTLGEDEVPDVFSIDWEEHSRGTKTAMH